MDQVQWYDQRVNHAQTKQNRHQAGGEAEPPAVVRIEWCPGSELLAARVPLLGGPAIF